MNSENDDSVVEGLTEQQIKDSVCRLVREVTHLKEDAKAQAKATREVVKDLESRMSNLLNEMEKRSSLPHG
jgi:hypothetical protein